MHIFKYSGVPYKRRACVNSGHNTFSRNFGIKLRKSRLRVNCSNNGSNAGRLQEHTNVTFSSINASYYAVQFNYFKFVSALCFSKGSFIYNFQYFLVSINNARKTKQISITSKVLNKSKCLISPAINLRNNNLERSLYICNSIISKVPIAFIKNYPFSTS